MRTKAFRRAQRQKYLNKTRKILKIWHMHKDIEESARLFCENRKKCSCCLCMNARHNKLLKANERLTIQERRALEFDHIDKSV